MWVEIQMWWPRKAKILLSNKIPPGIVGISQVDSKKNILEMVKSKFQKALKKKNKPHFQVNFIAFFTHF